MSNSEPNSPEAARARYRVEGIMDQLERYDREWSQINGQQMQCLTEDMLRRMSRLQSKLLVASAVHAPEIDKWLEIRHDQSVKSQLQSRINRLEIIVQSYEDRGEL